MVLIKTEFYAARKGHETGIFSSWNILYNEIADRLAKFAHNEHDMEQGFEDAEESKDVVKLPYPVGTVLTIGTDGNTHCDRIDRYIVGKNEVSAVLILDCQSEPRESAPVPVSDIAEKWCPAEL